MRPSQLGPVAVVCSWCWNQSQVLIFHVSKLQYDDVSEPLVLTLVDTQTKERTFYFKVQYNYSASCEKKYV